MDWSRHDGLSEVWTTQSLAYVAAVNAYVKHCNLGEEPGPAPIDTRAPLAMAVLEVVKEANRAGEIEELRRRLPPAHEPFVAHIKANAIPMSNVVWRDDTAILALTGVPGNVESAVRFRIDGRTNKSQTILGVGRARAVDGLVFGFADRVEHKFKDGTRRMFRIPSGIERPAYLSLEALNDERTVMAVFPEGVFLCRESTVERIFPSDGTEVPRRRFPMIHAALSPDGEHIACGEQDSQHVVMDTGGRVVCRFGPVQSEYPNHAAFTPDGRSVVASSCHMRTGTTVAANLDELRGVELDRRAADPRLRLVQHGFSVSASVFVGDTYVVGDRNGHLRAYAIDGTFCWQHACGSTITGLDASPDGTHLAVGTAAGVLHIIALDQAVPDPFQIGTASHHEVLRFMRWRGSGLLRW